MLFKPYLTEKIVTGAKTQTRRPIKAGETLIIRGGKKTVLTAGGRIKMQVGRDYAIPYGRGKPCRWWNPQSCTLLSYQELQEMFEGLAGLEVSHETVLEDLGYKKLRIIITDIIEEDVRTINYKDALAEGFINAMGFFRVWCGFYDATVLKPKNELKPFIHILEDRPAEKYQAFAYTFKVKGI